MCHDITQAPSRKGCRADLNALETGHSRVGEEDRYAQIRSERQVPCFIMCSNGTPLWKAQEAPALRKSWNVRVFGRPK